MIRILANDGMDKSAAEQLIKLGYDVDLSKYEGDALIDKIKNIEVLIVRSATKVRKDLIDEAVKGGTLKLIIRAGVGIDNIDHIYAKEQGIDVQNTPKSSSLAVAELAIGHMFSLARFIGISNHTIRNNEWNKKEYTGTEITGKTLGIVGFGRIGREIGKRAIGLGMNVQYYDLFGPFEVEDAYKWSTFEELIKTSDFITLHVPKGKDDSAVIGAKEMEMMKDGVYLINTSRGGVIDEDALVEYLDKGKLAGVALDVFDVEPLKNEKIMKHPRISLTPHVGASTKEAQKRIGEETIQVIENFKF
ncbi:MAG: D-2-hydroxyacid dehydrogenase [Clostridiales bacterium]|nr:D-2-hydroxyacid dehydrogenase [Clostridiales bacterium]